LILAEIGRLGGRRMTKNRMSQFAALVASVGFCVCGQQALALDPHFRIVTIGQAPVQSDAEQAAASGIHQLITAFGVLPPLDSHDKPEWPCFGGGGNADCSSIALYGLVIGDPYYTWPLRTCTSSTEACGQVYWVFETDVTSTTTPIDVSVTITQGTATKTTIYASGTYPLGVNNPGAGYIEVVDNDLAFGPGNCAAGFTCGTPVAGVATITVVTTIGTHSATGTAKITLSATD